MKNEFSIPGWILIIVVALIITNVALLILGSYPQAAYDRNNREHPLSVDCNAIAVDADRATTLKILLQHGEPSYQHLEKDKLVVRRGEVQCTVDFDASTHRVTKAESYVFPTFDRRDM